MVTPRYIRKLKRNVNSLGPRACYDEGKRCAETLCMDYHREYGIDVKIVRIFNTYGPRMAINDGRVVSNFIVQSLRGQDMTIYGDGSQTRSFMYVDDLIKALVLMMNSNGFTGPVNLGNPVELHIRDIATKIQHMVGSASKVLQKELPQDDPRQRQPDISLAKKMLNWEPRISLDEGLAKTIEYFRSII